MLFDRSVMFCLVLVTFKFDLELLQGFELCLRGGDGPTGRRAIGSGIASYWPWMRRLPSMLNGIRMIPTRLLGNLKLLFDR